MTPSASGPVDNFEDRIARLPLCTVSASRLGRALVLDYLRRHPGGATPRELREHLVQTLSWVPSDNTLYKGLLVELCKSEVSRPAVKIVPSSDGLPRSPFHVETKYRITDAGLRLLEAEQRFLLGPNAPLSSSVHLLRSILPLVGAPVGTLTGVKVNVGVLLQWMILWCVDQSGPETMIGVRESLYKLCGQVSWFPRDAKVPERWPRYQVVAREVRKLETIGALLRTGRPTVIHLTPDGARLIPLWQPDIQSSLVAALGFVEAAMRGLSPKATW